MSNANTAQYPAANETIFAVIDFADRIKRCRAKGEKVNRVEYTYQRRRGNSPVRAMFLALID